MKLAKDILACVGIIFVVAIALVFAMAIQFIGSGLSHRLVKINSSDLKLKRL